MQSLPAWERGLKRANCSASALSSESLPAWERGLKLVSIVTRPPYDGVAPRVGAWIETLLLQEMGRCRKVAPRVGAWIETLRRAKSAHLKLRRSPRGSVD